MTILVTGSRGAVAKHVIALLRERGSTVRAASAEPAEPATVRCDLTDPTTFAAALAGVHSVFLYAEPAHAAEFAAAATGAGVEHVVLLSSSSVVEPGAEAGLLASRHLDVERALDAAAWRVTALRPGAFAGNAMAWSWPVRAGRPVSLPYPGAHSAPIHEADLAEAAFAVLTRPELGGRPHLLTGPASITFAEQLAIVGAALGRPVEMVPVSAAQWKAEMADHVPGPYADALLDMWQRADGVPAEVTATLEELTERPPRTFATWAAEHAADFAER
jgi:uncharacterized protein YbjT (DUF2867 family)